MSTSAPLLLVSVRNAEEAIAALEGGADIIDIKEPLRGPLGFADRETMCEVVDAVGGKRRLSAAMGELAEIEDFNKLTAVNGITWVKFGLAKFQLAKDLWRQWVHLQTQMDERRELVAVAYADCAAARSLPPSQLARALHTRYSIFLLDTYTKDGSTVFDHASEEELAALTRDVRAASASFALAGSLQVNCMKRIGKLAPDIVGIRGAACDDGRKGRVRAEKVAEFRAALHAAANASCA
jgi:(5-formylfuran-3-yl)methyl phosphate synthase